MAAEPGAQAGREPNKRRVPGALRGSVPRSKAHSRNRDALARDADGVKKSAAALNRLGESGQAQVLNEVLNKIKIQPIQVPNSNRQPIIVTQNKTNVASQPGASQNFHQHRILIKKTPQAQAPGPSYNQVNLLGR